MQQPLWGELDQSDAVRMPDGRIRRENITDWALRQFQAVYGLTVTKRDIFHYVYAVLHHPVYRERYAENLKRELPHIPLVDETSVFWKWTAIAKRLIDLHVHYEQATEWPLTWIRTGVLSYRVTKMHLTPDRTGVIVNDSLTLAGIPPQVFDYRLGNRSALEWVIDQYVYSRDLATGLVSDPNQADDPGYIVRLIGQVVTVSMETVALVNELHADGLPINGEVYR